MATVVIKLTKLKESGLFAAMLILSACSIGPGYCDASMPTLRPIPVAQADVVETDSASSQPSQSTGSSESMQTIDEQSAKPDDKVEQIPQTIEPKTIKSEPEESNKEESPVKVESTTAEPVGGNQPTTAEKKDIGAKTAHFVTHLPQRLGLFTANVVVAAPATFVRRSAQYTKSNTKELIGDHKNPILLVPAGVLSSYYGLTSGLVEGTVFGITNSWKHSADGKITKESLGLEEDK